MNSLAYPAHAPVNESEIVGKEMLSLAFAAFAVQPGLQLRGDTRAASTICRKAVLQGTAAAAVSLLSVPRCRADEPFTGSYAKQGLTANPNNLGSKGISAYEKLKVDAAIKDLSEAIAAVNDAKLTPTLDYFAALLPLVKEEKLDTIEETSIQLAANNLVASSSSKFRLGTSLCIRCLTAPPLSRISSQIHC